MKKTPNKDNTDSGKFSESESIQSCPFCYENIQSEIIKENDLVFAIKDQYPVTEGHLLIIPRRHTRDYFTLSVDEKKNADELICTLRKQILNSDPTVTGFNIGVNCGESAGQTVFHAHVHLIPRRDGDTANPRGGVRGVIPEKMSY